MVYKKDISPRASESQDGAFSSEFFSVEELGWWHSLMHPSALEDLQEGIEGVLRGCLQHFSPVEQLSKQFCADFGRPTKELYAMCGLLLLAEFRNWTIDQTARAWTHDASVQFALNLPRDRQFLSPRTVDNYRRRLRQDDTAQALYEDLTSHLIKDLGLKIQKQRLDSTHMLSNMAKFGRLKLMSTTVRRFLQDIKRYRPADYAQVEAHRQERYSAQESRLFGQGGPNPEGREEALRTVSEDLILLISQFEDQAEVTSRKSYQNMVRVFDDQCEITPEETIEVRPFALDEEGKSGGVMQNTSDPDAGYSGHKGSGYQAQLNQAYDTGEGPGLITGCLVESANETDSAALGKIQEQQARMGTQPELQLADTAYGSQENVDQSAAKGIDLVAPVGGKPPKEKPTDPALQSSITEPEPESTTELAITTESAQATAAAPTAPRERTATGPTPEPTPQEKLNARRAAEKTEAWKERYRARSGVEGVHSAIDRMTGLKDLRVRGKRAVRFAIFLKIAGYNLHHAARIKALRAKKALQARQKPCFCLQAINTAQNSPHHIPNPIHKIQHFLRYSLWFFTHQLQPRL